MIATQIKFKKMKKHLSRKIVILLLLLCSFITNGCTETYILQTNTFEEVLVVEATITNELKKQEIKITKTARFEDTETKTEAQAEVYITDDSGNKYDFEEQSEKYVSKLEFEAIPGRKYTLTINTNDGRSYKSSAEALTTVNELEEINATVDIKNGERGVAIHVNSYDPTNNSKYYRYEYEETYKIVAPQWTREKLVVLDPRTVDRVPNSPETEICYSTKNNTALLLASTAEQKSDRVNYLVRFISDQNYIISHRYSILVKQYVESLAAYTFYSTLKKTSGNGSLLSQNQPGFFYGNLKSVDNTNEKIIGFFDVASVSSKRFFFNYSDLFPKEPLPPYYTECDIESYLFCFGFGEKCKGEELIEKIENHTLTYAYRIGPDSPFTYYLYPTPCGDCTSFSSNIKPSFWID
ncbi:protein of unknown function [Flavobacterium gillisiae]|uniref:DUF4249 domain-containing protein n=2 Tax=Flavobacterium gillisiae TaxID=150146 RepID=A0A1H3X4B0_9FLAO|nr:protein of unknown function [Flavobacterium gillisiae]